MVTAGVQSGAGVLHEDPGDGVLEWLVELAEAPDDVVDQVVDRGVGLLLHEDGVVLLVRVLLFDPEQVVHCVFQDLQHLLRNELFLKLHLSYVSVLHVVALGEVILS